jgi:hypothetical protein
VGRGTRILLSILAGASPLALLAIVLTWPVTTAYVLLSFLMALACGSTAGLAYIALGEL